MADQKPKVRVYAEDTITTHRDLPMSDLGSQEPTRFASERLAEPVTTTAYHWSYTYPEVVGEVSGISNVADTPMKLGTGLASHATDDRSPLKGLTMKDVDLSVKDLKPTAHNSTVRELTDTELSTFSAAFARATREAPKPAGRTGFNPGEPRPAHLR